MSNTLQKGKNQGRIIIQGQLNAHISNSHIETCSFTKKRPFVRKASPVQAICSREKHQSENSRVLENKKWMKNVCGSSITQDNESMTTKLQTSNPNTNRCILMRDTKNKDPIKEEEFNIVKHNKKVHQEVSDYYKYWKKKANEYQQINFKLDRENSDLRQQIQVLKHTVHQLKCRLEQKTVVQGRQDTGKYDLREKSRKIEEYYKIQILQLKEQMKQQEILLCRQQKLIKQISSSMEENHSLKRVLNHIQEKIEDKYMSNRQEDGIGKLRELRQNQDNQWERKGEEWNISETLCSTGWKNINSFDNMQG